MSDGPAIDAGRVIADLRELDRRTGGRRAARSALCWGEGWREARAFLGELLGEIGLEPERDEAGNALGLARRATRSRRWRSARTSTRCPRAAGSTARSG